MPTKLYEQYWTQHYGPLSDFNSKWPRLKNFIPTQAGLVIVDFGCGNGVLLNAMQSMNPDAIYLGLDVSAAALQQAQNLMPEVNFKKIEDGAPFPLETDSTDFVFSSEVMEHVYDAENAFHEIARILKPGGTFLITVPYHGFIKNLVISLFCFDRHFDPTGTHVRFFSKNTLHRELKKVGFKILEYGYYGRFWPLPHSVYVVSQKL